MKRIVAGVLIALVIAAVSLVGQQPKSYATVTVTPLDFARSGDFVFDGKTTVTLKADGRVEYSGTLDEATKAFWDAVESLGYTRECRPGEKPQKK